MSFEKVANVVARATGRPATFLVCLVLVVLWAATGPMFHFADTWQLVINTGTTIVTFLMVFLIQNTQNREGAALQAKLDELIRAVEKAEDRYIGLEQRSEKEINQIKADGPGDGGGDGHQPTHAGRSGTIRAALS